MIKALLGTEVAEAIQAQVLGSVVESSDTCVQVDKSTVAGVMRYLKESPEYAFDYLNNLTAVDNLDHFEVIYNITSMTKKHSLCIKARVFGRENLQVPTVTSLWSGADFQEREIFDLFGIRFSGHPNLKRIVLWEGFDGHPLRKDFL